MAESSSRNNYKSRYHSNNDFTTRLSKTLSYVLRHKAESLGVKVDCEGFVYVSDLKKLNVLRQFQPLTMDKLQDVIDQDKKQRFSLIQRGDAWLIRANQGHSGHVANSLDDSVMLEPVLSSVGHPICVHGTDKASWSKISSSGGLSRMSRKHIHMSSQHKGSEAMISGMRNRSNVMIYIDLDAAIAAGIKFFISDNQVILSEGDARGMIPTQFFKEVKFLD